MEIVEKRLARAGNRLNVTLVNLAFAGYIDIYLFQRITRKQGKNTENRQHCKPSESYWHCAAKDVWRKKWLAIFIWQQFKLADPDLRSRCACKCFFLFSTFG